MYSSAFEGCGERLEQGIDDFFDRLGRLIVGHPSKTLLGTVLFVCACATGFLNFKVETKGENLWVPPNSQAKKDERFVNNYFESGDRFSQVLYVDSNVVTLPHVEEVWDLYGVVASTAKGPKSYANLCSNRDLTGVCTNIGVTQFWSNNRTLYNSQVETLDDLIDTLSSDTFPDGSFVNRDLIFGKFETDDNNRVVSSRGFLTTYTLGGSESDVMDWELEFIDNMDRFSSSVGDFFYIAERSQDDELGAAIGGDTSLLAITYTVMIIFTCWVTAKGFTFSQTRIGVSLCGIGYILLSMVAGYGFCSGIGIPFNTLHMVLPFVVVGIGVDDIFIITATFDQLERSIPDPALRMVATLRKCGLAIAYTSATDVAAFMLGATSALPSIQQFCIYAAFTLLFNFCFQVTGYSVLLYWDAIRRDKDQLDMLCCLGSFPADRTDAAPKQTVIAIKANDYEAPVDHAMDTDDGEDLTTLQLFFRDMYFPLIDNLKVRVVITVIFVAYLAVSLWAITEVNVGFDILILTPDNSYVRDFINEGRKVDLWLQDKVVPVGMYFEDNSYHMQHVQEEIIRLEKEFVNRSHCAGPVTSWLSDFNKWVKNSTDYKDNLNEDGYLTDANLFYTAVGEFTEEPQYTRYTKDIIFQYEDTSPPSPETITGIRTSRLGAFHTDLTESRVQVRTMRRTRSFVRAADISPDGFAFSGAYIFYETEAVLLMELVQNILSALAAVAIVSFFVLLSVRAVVVIILIVAAIDVNIVGSMMLWNLDLNTVTVVQLVMAVGLVVDYTAHILHCYMQQPTGLSKSEKVKSALVEIGPSVLLGCTTTFLGILPLAFAGTAIFRIFFRMFFSIIVFGGTHGLILLPVILPWLPLPEKLHEKIVIAVSEDKKLKNKIGVELTTESALSVEPNADALTASNAGVGSAVL